MAKVYINRDYKRLNPTSRYTPSYLLNETSPDFITDRFPDYKDKGLKGRYNMNIDDSVEWLAVIEYDETQMTPKDLKMELKSFKDYFKARFLTKAQIESELQARWYTKEWDSYKIRDEVIDETLGETIPAKYLVL